jgi:hypothetical protein
MYRIEFILRAREKINRSISIPYSGRFCLDPIPRNPRNSAAIASFSRNRLKPNPAQLWAPINRFIPSRALRLLLFIFLVHASAFAQVAVSKGDPGTDPFTVVANADPLELAKVVERLGDQAVSSRLKRDMPIEIRIAAIRATRWMRAPESVLSSLAVILGSRDSELAPVAATAALRIASAITNDTLSVREIMPEELAESRALFVKASANSLLRPDIRLQAAQTAETLAAAGS